jgi:hypothetical protein
MIFGAMFDRFAQERPMAVLAMMTVRNIFSDRQIDRIFEQASKSQYTRELRFSLCAKLLGDVALCGAHSVNAVYKKNERSIPVSVSAVYQKLQCVESQVCEAIVAITAVKAVGLIKQLASQKPQPVEGYRLRIVDGNYLAKTQRRIKELRQSSVSALPGMSLALYDYATELIDHLIVSEDGHTNERALMLRVGEILEENDLLMADSLYCTMVMFDAVASKKAKFLIRHHGGLHLQDAGTSKKGKGRCTTGKVTFQPVTTTDSKQYTVITIHRDRPTKKGQSEVRLLTNLQVTAKLATELAELYLKRWKIEESFRQLTEYLSCEIKTLGYPKAALLAFSLAVVAYNCLRCLKAALAAHFGQDEVDNKLSMFYVSQELKQSLDGVQVAIDEEIWKQFETMNPAELTACMSQVTKLVYFQQYRKSPKAYKKKKAPIHSKRNFHQATFDVLEARKQNQLKTKP